MLNGRKGLFRKMGYLCNILVCLRLVQPFTNKRRRRNDIVFRDSIKIRKKFLSEEIGVIMDLVIGLSLRASSGSVRDELNCGGVHFGI